MLRSRSDPTVKSLGLVLPAVVCRLLLSCSLHIAHCTLHPPQPGNANGLPPWPGYTQSSSWIRIAVGRLAVAVLCSALTMAARVGKRKLNQRRDAIRDIHFYDDLNGWIVCERSIYELKSNDEPRSYLMKTADGGQTWKRATLRAPETLITRAIFSRTGRGWAFGEGGLIYTTNDSGATWIKTQVPTRYLLLGGTFIDERTGWLVGAGSTVLQTSDGGASWLHGRLQQTANVRFNSTSFVDARFGWAVGGSGAIYRTTNGGISWQPQHSGVTSDLFDVKFLDASKVGRSVLTALSCTQRAAGCVGRWNEAGHLTRWNASSSPIARMVGLLASAGRSSRTAQDRTPPTRRAYDAKLPCSPALLCCHSQVTSDGTCRLQAASPQGRLGQPFYGWSYAPINLTRPLQRPLESSLSDCSNRLIVVPRAWCSF